MTALAHRPDTSGSGDLSLVAAVNGREKDLLGELTIGAAVSAVAGSALWLWGRRTGRGTVAAFGRQTVGWAAADLAIGVVGRRMSARKPALDVPKATRKARRLRRLTGANAGLDVGYVVAGAALARDPKRRGDGLGMLVQGLFLLWLDARHARGFHRLALRG
jgi:hypothetical protein